MQMVPQTLNHLAAPGISAIYKKKDFSGGEDFQDVLVIETNFSDLDEDPEAYDNHMMDLLLNLEDIKEQAEISAGHIDRIDIRAF